MAALLITVREIVEKPAVCSHLLENQLPGYSIVKKVHFFNTRTRQEGRLEIEPPHDCLPCQMYSMSHSTGAVSLSMALTPQYFSWES